MNNNRRAFVLGSSQSGPYFISQPQDAIIPSGNTLALPCSAPGSSIVWRHSLAYPPDRDHVLADHDRYRKQLVNGSLVLSGMAASLSGYYQCAAHHRNGVLLSRVARVTTPEVPELIPSPEKMSVSALDTVLIPCPIKHKPNTKIIIRGTNYEGAMDESSRVPVLVLNVSWSFGGAAVTSSMTPLGSLILENVSKANEGIYKCTISVYGEQRQLSSRTSSGTELTVGPQHDGQPIVTTAPQNVSIVQGMDAILECGGSAVKRISWHHNGTLIDSSHSVFSLEPSHSRWLSVRNANSKVAGSITCLLSNEKGTTRLNAQLVVLTPPILKITVKSKSPNNLSHDRSDPLLYSTQLRSELVLSCDCVQDCDHVTWYKDGERLREANSREVIIPGVISEDVGVYQCIAISKLNNEVDTYIVLQLSSEHESPKKGKQKKFNSNKLSKHLFDSLKSEKKTFFTQNDYQDQDYDELGEVSSAYTTESDLFVFHGGLTVNSSLASPSGLRVVRVNNDSLKVMWDQVGYQVNGYTVLYKIKGSEREREISTDGNKNELMIEPLEVNSEYVLSVMARTDTQTSMPSEPIEASTVPSIGPTVLSASVQNQKQLQLSWTAIPNYHKRYRIEFTQPFPNGSCCQTNRFMSSTTSASFNLPSIINNNNNNARVRVRANAWGPYKVVSLTLMQPTVIITQQGRTSMTVVWEAQDAESITGYQVQYRPVTGSKKKTDNINIEKHVRKMEINNLQPGVDYQVRVCAISSSISSEICSRWSSTKRNVLPAPPEKLTSRAGHNWISVWWAPLSEIDPPLSYVVGWGLGVADDQTHMLTAEHNSYVIRNLKPNSEYVISVRSSNSLGLGAPVYVTVRTIEESEEEDLLEGEEEDFYQEEYEEEGEQIAPPLGVKAVMMSATTAVVYWIDPTLPKGQSAFVGRWYVVRWSGGGRTKEINSTQLSCMVDDLRPYTLYEFTVKVVKDGISSAWSLVAVNRSLEAISSSPKELKSQSKGIAWAAPDRPHGVITGYVVTYRRLSESGSINGDNDSGAIRLGADKRFTRLEGLAPDSVYQIAVQARNSAGLSPPSAPLQITTAPATMISPLEELWPWPWYVAGLSSVLVLALSVLVFMLCCRQRQQPPMELTYQKSSASAALKPPDLWIHHDQMELKRMDKHNSMASSSSAEMLSCGGSLVKQSAFQQQTNHSLDRRMYVPTYVDSCWSGSCSSDHESGSQKTQPMGGPGCVASCDRRRRVEQQPVVPHNISPRSSLASIPVMGQHSHCVSSACAPLNAPVNDVYASVARERGMYVAYEPLGNITHRESISSSGCSGVACDSSPLRNRFSEQNEETNHCGTMGRGGTLRDSSPYKKSANSSPGHINNRLHTLGMLPPHSSSELQPLSPSRSSERLQKEMQNLEGLMKDLSAITQQQFQC